MKHPALRLLTTLVLVSAACGQGEETRDPCQAEGERRCSDDRTVQVCTTAGYWRLLEQCGSSDLCEAGTCVSVPSAERRCGDGVDEDRDGTTDCADEDCADAPECVEQSCDDGLDDDGDGATDCDDGDCSDSPLCQPESLCDDGLDNDGDGATDCDDADCLDAAGCRNETACDDGADNDDDGAPDCEDVDCREDAACRPVCAEDRILSLGSTQFSSRTFNAGDDWERTCGEGEDVEDAAALWTAPAKGVWRFELTGPVGAVLALRDPACGAEAPLFCGQAAEGAPARTSLALALHESVVLVVDAPASGFVVEMALQEESALCDDAADNDGDGRTDCDDPDCTAFAGCLPETCAPDSEADDDGDGLAGCEDLDCFGHPDCGGTADVSVGTGLGADLLTGFLPAPGIEAPLCGDAADGLKVAWTAAADGVYRFEAGAPGGVLLSDVGGDACEPSVEGQAAFEQPVSADQTLVLQLVAQAGDPIEARAFTLGIVGVEIYERCDDGIDNDGDGAIDAEDPDCDGIAP